MTRSNKGKINILALAVVFALVLSMAGCAAGTGTNQTGDTQVNQTSRENQAGQIVITDDMGNTITLDKPCEKIISLYSAHTENLYMLGLKDEIIGVGTSDIYPADVLDKPVYDYKSDPETVIAAGPDLVLIRPFINRKAPDFVEALQKAGITVVSLYPESFDDFDGYIETLGKLCGKEKQAEEKLKEFHKQLDGISAITSKITDKGGVFFESTETDLRTVTADSMPGRAIVLAGGVNIAGDLEPISEGSSIAAFGAEKILQKADEIDLYVSQRGAMNAGGNYHSISIRPGFDTIKAVKEQNVLLINEKIISSPNFRYYKGVREIARMLYPEIFDSIDEYQSQSLITRGQMAKMLIQKMNKSIFVPTSSYYKSEHSGHTYGRFADVSFMDDDFDYIETAVVSGYMTSYTEEGKEYFKPDQTVTKEELAKILYMAGNFPELSRRIKISDLSSCENPQIVQKIVDNGVMGLEDGDFNPKQELTQKEAYDILSPLTFAKNLA